MPDFEGDVETFSGKEATMIQFLERFLRVVRALTGDKDVTVCPMNKETLALEGHSETYEVILARM